MASFYLTFTENQKNYVEKYWGDIRNIEDDKAQEIVEELLDDELGKDVKVTNAFFVDDENIFYETDEQTDDSDDECRMFTDKYLSTIGMSKSDF